MITKIAVFLLLLPFSVHSQSIYESLMTLSRTYKPFLGKELSTLSVDLVKQYSLDGGVDTVHYLLLKVSQRTAEVTGYSIAASFFGSSLGYGGAAGGSKAYAYQKENGLISMGYDEFMQFYAALNKTFTYINNQKQNKASKNNTLVTYSYRDIIFGGEYIPGPTSQLATASYYIQVGEAVFTMDEASFLEIAQTMRATKLIWDKITM